LSPREALASPPHSGTKVPSGLKSTLRNRRGTIRLSSQLFSGSPVTYGASVGIELSLKIVSTAACRLRLIRKWIFRRLAPDRPAAEVPFHTFSRPQHLAVVDTFSSRTRKLGYGRRGGSRCAMEGKFTFEWLVAGRLPLACDFDMKFSERYPDLIDLACAPERQWQYRKR
jgi:hypothetical protein